MIIATARDGQQHHLLELSEETPGSSRRRAEHEKTGFGHTKPLTTEATAALEEAWSHNPGVDESPVFPAPRDPMKPVGRYGTRDWWRRAERLAGMEPKVGRGWHSLRRKFATDLIDQPLKVVYQLGGWKDHDTLLSCYQRPDRSAMRAALEARRKVSKDA